ncbi:MAG TPA: hypothetical protein VE690_12155 [Rhodopila sp.]|nr:hypothetical protein [Rhodopila sp.]
MPRYTILPRRRQPGYKLEIVTDEGSHHTILGFQSEAEAQEWAERDQKLDQVFRPAAS